MKANPHAPDAAQGQSQSSPSPTSAQVAGEVDDGTELDDLQPGAVSLTRSNSDGTYVDGPRSTTEPRPSPKAPLAQDATRPQPVSTTSASAQSAPFPPLHSTVTSTSTRPYSAFSRSTKALIVGLGASAAVFSPISSNIFVPAIPTLSTAFGKSESAISQAVTVYLVFQAITPSFFGSMSDTYGRRPLYLATLVVYLGANIGLALCPTTAYWLLLVMRILQATGGSAVIAIGYGCVADVSEPGERGKYAAAFQIGTTLGPALGPLLGGIFTQTLGWRSIFWFLTIATGVVLVPLILFLPETLRSIVGDGSIPPPMLNTSPTVLLRRRKMAKEMEERGEAGEPVHRPPTKPYQPFSAFMLLLTPEILLVFIFASLLYLEFYSLLTVYSTALKQTYGLSELKIGLCYLPAGIGAIAASQINGRQLDYWFRKEERRVGGDYRKKPETFDIEFTRLRCMIPFVTLNVVACVSLGWCLEAKAPLAATLVVNFFVGLGSGTIATATLYGQDIAVGKGGAVSASLNLVRCIFGAVGVAVIQTIYKAMGAGWTFVLLSGIVVLGIPMPWLVVKRGKMWRQKREERRSVK